MKNLPINKFKDEIIYTVEKNDVTVIKAETGAGKSTQVPQFLVEAGHRVVVTQPRRIATQNLSTRVAKEMGCMVGDKVGFKTAYESNYSKSTEMLFVTDGLQMIRELTSGTKVDVLVIDEVHEGNLNIETLVAWTKKQIKKGWDTRVVLMSATLDAKELAKFYSQDVPVIDVPGKLFPVTEYEFYGETDKIESIKMLVDQRRNVLVFEPGKREIEETIYSLEGCGAQVFPLHGEMDYKEQQKCFAKYDLPKVVVATNVAETSLTIPDIDAVVDSGKEKRIELKDGIEVLTLGDISKANSTQRKGRAGRTKPGVYYVNTYLEDWVDQRDEYPKAEIERVRLDQLVLRLANAGIDATEIEFFHQPDIEVLNEAKRALTVMGALDADGKITKVGRLMSKMPVKVQYARMIVAANELGVTDHVITAAAILETGSLKDRDAYWNWFRLPEYNSDILAELDLWEIARRCRGKNELRKAHIFARNFFKALDLRKKIVKSLSGVIKFSSDTDREKIRQAVITGMVDHVYVKDWGSYKNGDNVERTIDEKSSVSVYSSGKIIVGLPFDLEIKARHGKRTLNLVTMVTTTSYEELLEIAPHLFTTDLADAYYNIDDDNVTCTKKNLFNGNVIDEESVVMEDHPNAGEVLLETLVTRTMN